MSWIDIVRALEEERRARAERLIGELCGGGGAVLLFGSRARGDNTPLSDWDLAHLVKSGEYRVEAAAVGQIFVVPVDKLEEILSWSMVALDAYGGGRRNVEGLADRPNYELDAHGGERARPRQRLFSRARPMGVGSRRVAARRFAVGE